MLCWSILSTSDSVSLEYIDVMACWKISKTRVLDEVLITEVSVGEILLDVNNVNVHINQ